MLPCRTVIAERVALNIVGTEHVESVGALVGVIVGTCVGAFEVGALDGDDVGLCVGTAVGS